MDQDISMKSVELSYESSFTSNHEDENVVSQLLDNVPVLKDIFNIHYKVGEGTFSSVFLATLKNSKNSKSFAVKHLVPTCHPGRIERELQCLKDIGGKDHVVGLELCLRNAGSVVFVMPYLRHDKFSEYVYNMSPEEMKDYMRALLMAVKRVHQFNIMHRDIKPSNFLYDRSNRRYLLVDFGLAQEYVKESHSQSNSRPTSLLKEKKSDENKSNVMPKSISRPVEKCYCFGKAKVCSLCLVRPPQNASRAGTPGFRAPEVLLKHKNQTPAIDIWACGVIMLSILSGTQPFFRSPDDMVALAEITTLFGSTAMQQVSKKLGKKLMFHEEIPSSDIVVVCKKLKQRFENSKDTLPEKVRKELNITYPDEAYELLKRLLDIDYKTRITAEEALLHPFFTK